MRNTTAKSFWIRKKYNSFIKTHPISIPKTDELLIKTIYSGISYGTEKIVYTGAVPQSQKKLMRCPFQEGEFGNDLKYGYINVGKIIEGPNDYKNKPVFTLFPHQTLFTLKKEDVTFIPDHIPLKRCLLTANMETAINALWDTLPTCGDRILVLGAGIVGILTAYVAKSIFGTDVLLVDTFTENRKIIQSLGINFSQQIPKDLKVNIAYECSGDPNSLNKLRSNLRDEAMICILSWYGDNISKVNFGEDFLSKRIKIIFSQVSKISQNRSKYWNIQERRELAISLLGDKKLDMLIEKEMLEFNNLPEFFSNIDDSKRYLCKVIDYHGE